MQSSGCQIHGLPRMSEGNEETGPQSLRRRVKLALKRRLNHRVKRSLKRFSVSLANWLSPLVRRREASSVRATAGGLEAGDKVRVRSGEEIRATLDLWNEFQGCGFFQEMEMFCGTTQIVLKPVKRFVDERDYRLKKCTGVVLLKDVICQGTTNFGKCDRACFFFWREEWLERID